MRSCWRSLYWRGGRKHIVGSCWGRRNLCWCWCRGLCWCWWVLNCFPETTHLIRIICDNFVNDDECFNLVAHWNRATRNGKRHRTIGCDDNLNTICVCVQHVRIQIEIDVWLIQVKFEERVDKRDEILFHR